MEPRTVRTTREPGVEVVVDVWDADSSAGPPVVLLHGLSQQRRFWDPVRRRLRTRPVACVDQRGHGDSDTPVGVDYGVASCAADSVAVLDALGWERAVLVGHSWGAAVALAAAATHPGRTLAVGLIDGGLWSPAALGPREAVRQRLTPPPLGIPEGDLWAAFASGALAASWTDETRQALTPTFTIAADGTVRTRLGLDRHMRVLDGLLDHDPAPDLAATASSATPVWAVVCEPEPTPGRQPDEWARAKDSGVELARRHANVMVHHWSGAVHDVPLQWPALVAGFVDALAEAVPGTGEAR